MFTKYLVAFGLIVALTIVCLLEIQRVNYVLREPETFSGAHMGD
jgi:hypothetical protein